MHLTVAIDVPIVVGIFSKERKVCKVFLGPGNKAEVLMDLANAVLSTLEKAELYHPNLSYLLGQQL